MNKPIPVLLEIKDNLKALTKYITAMKVIDVNSRNMLLTLIVLLSATFFVIQSALATEKSINMENASLGASSNKTELVSFVESAVAYAQKNGKDKALKEFSNKTVSFVRGDLYIYAYDSNGINIAHPFKPDWIGTDKLNITDSNGVPYIRNLINVAKKGDGFTYFIFSNPAHDNRDEIKIGYAMKVDDSWWLGSGLYLSNISASFTEKERDELVSFVEGALQFAKENGKQKSLAVFNDLNGNFTRDASYIFAYDYEGRNLALPNQPELVGTNRFDARDPDGVDFVRQAIDTARRGSGFLYYIYPDPSKNMTQSLKLSYVVNVDDTWFLGSGIYPKGEIKN